MPPLTAPALTTTRVSLVPVTPADYSFLIELGSWYEWRDVWGFHGETPSPEAFARALWAGVTCQFVAHRHKTDEAFGWFGVNRMNPRHGYATVSAIVRPDFTRTIWTTDALTVFVDHVFRTWNLRKVHVECPARVYGSFGGSIGSLLEVEGRLEGHTYHDDGYEDLVILTLRREDALRITARRAFALEDGR